MERLEVLLVQSIYTRVIPSHAVELTAAYLDRSVAGALQHHPTKIATLEQKQELAALIHLCGAGAGDAYVRRGLRLAEGQRCGDHDARDYVARVTAMKRVFRDISHLADWLMMEHLAYQSTTGACA
jgi:hypothetical protein